MSFLVRIQDTHIPLLEYQGKRVVTLAMIDQVHQRPNGTAKRNFWKNRHRFILGRDYFELSGDEIRQFLENQRDEFRPAGSGNQPDEIRTVGFYRPQGGLHPKVILMTEYGYLLLAKSFNDDLAWSIQSTLIDVYFRSHEKIGQLERELEDALDSKRCAARDCFQRRPHWRTIHDLYLRSYRFTEIAHRVRRSPQCCRHAVKRMIALGLIRSRQVSMHKVLSRG